MATASMNIAATKDDENISALTKAELNKLWMRYMWFYNSSGSFERFHAMGIVYSLLPLFNKYYKGNEDVKFAAMKRHTTFFNTEMQVGSLIQGITVGLEEQKALGGEVSDDVIVANKVGLMGPIAGIGDSLWVGVVIPIILSIALALSSGGSAIGPIFYIIVYVGLVLLGSHYLFNQGYHLGIDAVKTVIGAKATRVVNSVILFGTMIMGGLAASYISLTLKLVLGSGKDARPIQDILNGIFPKMIPLLLVLAIWGLMSRFKISPLVMTLCMFVLAFVLALFHII